MRRERLFRNAVGCLAAVLAVGTAASVAIPPAAGSAATARPAADGPARPSPAIAAQAIGRSQAAVGSLAGQSLSAPRTPTHRPARPPAARARVVDGQRVSVTAPSRRATVAVVQRWVHLAGSWVRVGAPMYARIGAAGVTAHPSEKLAATPIGSFSLTQAFGGPANTDNSITALPYIHIRYGDTWGARPTQPTYNRYYNCHCRGATLFALRNSLFRYGVVIDYNRTPVVPGAGSGFFLHVTNGLPTGGCVAVPAGDVRALLGWLRPQLHPRIVIGVAPRS